MSHVYPAGLLIDDTALHQGRFGKLVALRNSEIQLLYAENIFRTEPRPANFVRTRTEVRVDLNNHGFLEDDYVHASFEDGGEYDPQDGSYEVAFVNANQFTIDAPDTAGYVKTGQYLQEAASSTITITLDGHGYQVGNTVDLAFTNTSGASLNNATFAVESVDENTFTVDDGSDGAGQENAGDVTAAKVISGNVNIRPERKINMHTGGEIDGVITGVQLDNGAVMAYLL